MSKKSPEVMDPSMKERLVGEAKENHPRLCYAAKTLIAEVLALFPETQYTITGPNGRGVALEVRFDCTDGPSVVRDLFRVLRADPRVETVDVGEMDAKVHFYNRPRTYDLRDSFGLDEAWTVLTDDEEWDGGDAEKTTPDVKDGGGA